MLLQSRPARVPSRKWRSLYVSVSPGATYVSLSVFHPLRFWASQSVSLCLCLSVFLCLSPTSEVRAEGAASSNVAVTSQAAMGDLGRRMQGFRGSKFCYQAGANTLDFGQ